MWQAIAVDADVGDADSSHQSIVYPQQLWEKKLPQEPKSGGKWSASCTSGTAPHQSFAVGEWPQHRARARNVDSVSVSGPERRTQLWVTDLV